MESKDKCKLCEASLNIEGFLKSVLQIYVMLFTGVKSYLVPKKIF